MFIKSIKSYIALILSITYIANSIAMDVESLHSFNQNDYIGDCPSRALRPNRDLAWQVNHRPELLYEYYISGYQNGCSFRLFDLERAEAVDLILEHLDSLEASNKVIRYL